MIYAPSDFRDEENYLKTISGRYLSDKINYVVTQDNNKPEVLKKDIDRVSEISSRYLPTSEKRIIDITNKFFKNLISKASPLLEEKVLTQVSFGIEAPEYFLLRFLISKDIVKLDDKLAGTWLKPENVPTDFTLIIKVSVIGDQLYLEAVGKEIRENSAERFADRIFDFINAAVKTAANFTLPIK